jgi:adenosine kinase
VHPFYSPYLTYLKVFALNLSAPYVPQSFGAQLHQVLPYCDIIIGNECEAEAWASANGLAEETDLHEIAKAIIAIPKFSISHPRIVIFTRGAESTLLVTSTEPRSAKFFPVEALSGEEIVDTNGAGDAFAGGFLAALVSGKELDECIETGHRLARMCIGQVGLSSEPAFLESSVLLTIQVGAQYKWPKVNIL